MNTKKQWNKPVLANLSHSDTRGSKAIIGVNWTEDHMASATGAPGGATTGHVTNLDGCFLMSGGTFTLTNSSITGAAGPDCPYGNISEGVS